MKLYKCADIAALLAMVFFSLSACSSGGAGVNNIEELKSASSKESLPVCSKKTEGDEAIADGHIYECKDGDWVRKKSTDTENVVEELSELPYCNRKHIDEEYYVEEEDAYYLCEDGDWVKESSSSKEKSSDNDDDDDPDSGLNPSSSANGVNSSGAVSDGGEIKPVSGNVTKKRIGPVSQYGQLQAGAPSGTGRIYGSCKGVTAGNEVVVQGMSLFWSIASEGSLYWKSDIVDGLVSKHKIQLIRAPMGINENWGNGNYFTKEKTATYQNMMDEVVAAAIENDIYVIIDYHSHSASSDVGKATTFFERMAQKWGSYDNVIFEIYNEPEASESWSSIKDYANTIVATIRQYSDNLIVVGNPSYDQHPDYAVGSKVSDTKNNVAYTFHFYAGQDKYMHEIDEIGTNAEYAMKHGISVFVTEWGVSGPSGAGSIVSSRSSAWYSWMKTNKLSGANWAVSKKNEAASYFTTSGAWDYSTSGNWVNSNVFAGLPSTYTVCDGSSVPGSSTSTNSGSSTYSSASGSGDDGVDVLNGQGLFNENGSTKGWTLVTPGARVGKVAGETDDDGTYVLAFWSNGILSYGSEYVEDWTLQATHTVSLKRGYSYTLKVGFYSYNEDGYSPARTVNMGLLDSDFDTYEGWSFDNLSGAYKEYKGTYCHTYASDNYAIFYINGGASMGGFSVPWVVLEEKQGCN